MKSPNDAFTLTKGKSLYTTNTELTGDKVRKYALQKMLFQPLQDKIRKNRKVFNG